MRLLLTLAVTLVVAGPFAAAGTMTWDTVAEDLARPVRAIEVHEGVGFAVGDGGLLLRLVGDTWEPMASPTDRDLLDVDLYDAVHGLAVGDDGVVLDYRTRWGDQDGHPVGVASAFGESHLAGATTRRVEWKIPLTTTGIGTHAPFGLGVETRTHSALQTHPTSFQRARPATAEALTLTDIPIGTPTIDGTQDNAWASAMHASYAAGPVPFTLYLLRDAGHLYGLISSAQPITSTTLQIHGQHGDDARPGDVRLAHSGLPGNHRDHERVGDDATWAVVHAPGALGVDAFHAATFRDATHPVAAGTAGALLLGAPSGWALEALGTSKTIRGADSRDGVVFLVGSAANGGTGGVMYRHHGTSATTVTLPTGTYGLHDIDLASCRAVGSGGTVLTCLGGDPTTWSASVLHAGVTFHHASHDEADPERAWIAGHDSGGDGVLYRYRPDTGNWQRWGLPRDTPAVTGLGFGQGGPLVATLLEDILVLRRHAPTFTSVPSSASGPQGEPIVIPVSGSDEDGDPLILDVPPIPGLPPDSIDIEKLVENVFRIIVVPPFDVEGVFNLTMILKDGDFEVTAGIPITIIDANGPPVWDPHPDVVIPHSVPFSTAVHADDPDGDPLTLSAPVLPAGAIFNDLGLGDGDLDWTPLPGDVGVHPVTLTADDGTDTTDLSFTITVVNNRPPVIDIATGGGTICVKGPWWPGTRTFFAQATDPEGGPLTYQWSFSDDLSVAFGQSVSHTYTTVGVHTVTLTVTDDVGLQAVRVLTVIADDCIHVEADLLEDCVDMLEQASGYVLMWDHTGAPANGTYKAEVWWRSPVFGLSRHVTTGPIVDGFAFFTLPYDHDPGPLNDLWRHTVYVEGIVTDTAHGDTERMKVTLSYEVQPVCRLLNVKEP